MENFFSINFLAVIIAIIANQVIGALWYSPVLFGKVWMKELGITPESISKKDASRSMFRAFLYSIINFVLLAYLIELMQTTCTFEGMMMGFFLGLFAIVQMGINATFENKSLKLYTINAAYPLLSYTIGGLIIGLM